MGHESEEEKDHRLRLIKSPIVAPPKEDYKAVSVVASEELGGYRDDPNFNCPEFEKHEEATNVELFYDLFFAANLTVFSEVHEVTNQSGLASYIGYFCMLWFTWALTGLFDVRFVTDSIFERLARSFHLGVMIGFAVVAAQFDPTNQDQTTFRTMSLILMISRLTLAVQYGSILCHVRRFPNTKLPLGIMVAINVTTAIIYLGLAFAVGINNNQVYIAWYIFSAVETVLTLALSRVWRVLSFEGTHLISRMSLLTLIIIGEGIIVVCSNITLIVKNANSWTPPTIGVVTSAVATLYFVYMIYFDWMRRLQLPGIRQLLWMFLHFPFHLMLTLFVEGSSQFIIWYKIFEVLDNFSTLFTNALNSLSDPSVNITTSLLVQTINDTVWDVFDQYYPKYYDTIQSVNDIMADLGQIPDSFWYSNVTDNDPTLASFITDETNLIETVANSLLASFNIDGFQGVTEATSTEAELQDDVFNEDSQRFNTVYIYAFAAAGAVIIFLNLLLIVSRVPGGTRHGGWTPFNYFRCGVNFALGLGLCLLTLINLNANIAGNYQDSPWVLPTICLTFFAVLVLGHLPHPRGLSLGRRRSQGREKKGFEFGSGATE